MSLENFYNDWYAHGYMDEWPAEKKARVYHLIRELGLPEKGKALDFGCGNGVFTDVVKQALPLWEVYGSDLSTLAVENAAKRFPDCRFLTGKTEELNQIKFDFIFSHHVLEHVEDPEGIAAMIGKMASPEATMLHILPCGNKGSLEYRFCTWAKDGIQATKGNTFFFEEEMHLQRFTSAQLSSLFQQEGFKTENGFYANQYYGAIQWISGMPKQFINNITNYRRGVNLSSRLKLWYYRSLLVFLYYLQRPYTYYQKNYEKDRRSLSFLRRMLFSLSSFFRSVINKLAEREWRHSRQLENGSEMYLFFHRQSGN
jgi:SAM-dependent methyltransferase